MLKIYFKHYPNLFYYDLIIYYFNVTLEVETISALSNRFTK